MTTKPKTRKAAVVAADIDPIFAAIAEHKAISKELWGRLYDALNEAEDEARKTHGMRPSCIWWRNCDVFSDGYLDYRREEFLREPGADPKQIEEEYQDAAASLAAAKHAGVEWDKRAGITLVRKQYERGKLAEDRAKRHLARTKPTTPAGAGALVAYIQSDLEDVELEGWHSAALKTVATALARMNKDAA
jgi:hypothetical protein